MHTGGISHEFRIQREALADAPVLSTAELSRAGSLDVCGRRSKSSIYCPSIDLSDPANGAELPNPPASCDILEDHKNHLYNNVKSGFLTIYLDSK